MRELTILERFTLIALQRSNRPMTCETLMSMTMEWREPLEAALDTLASDLLRKLPASLPTNQTRQRKTFFPCREIPFFASGLEISERKKSFGKSSR